MNNRAKMEESIRTLYGKVFNAGQAGLLPGLIAGPYISTTRCSRLARSH